MRLRIARAALLVMLAPASLLQGQTPTRTERLAIGKQGAATVEQGAAAGNTTVEYLVEVYESPSTAPPPEVAGPRGTRLFTGRVRASAGQQVRQFIAVGPKTANPARAISIGLTPTVDGTEIRTAAVVDTNLPIGEYDQKKNPVWLRCTLDFTVQAGETRYVSELELASTAAPTVAPPAGPSGGGTAGKVADAALGAGTDAATAVVPGASYLPSLGGLFGGGGQPKARKTMLLISLTPAVVGSVPR